MPGLGHPGFQGTVSTVMLKADLQDFLGLCRKRCIALNAVPPCMIMNTVTLVITQVLHREYTSFCAAVIISTC